MKKIIAIIFSIAILFLSIFLYFHFFSFKKVNLNGYIFKAELAASDAKRTEGLSKRKDICENCAMLFIFEKPGEYSFWMKDTRFSLDIIWILNNEIAYIANDIPADSKESLEPPVLADKVLEINGGLAEKYGLKVGDEVKF